MRWGFVLFGAALVVAACDVRRPVASSDAGGWTFDRGTYDRGVDRWIDACPPGRALCAGQCVDLSVDPANCGGCGNVCKPSGHPVYCPRPGSCLGGQCEHHPGLCVCGTSWVNPESDNDHCGGCGKKCDTKAGYNCQSGACSCVAGMTDCGGECVDTDVDPANCGACGIACAPGASCTGGACKTLCCYDAQNGSEPPSTSCAHGATWIAWQYVPSCDLALIRIELHTDGGWVALLQDAGGKPGKLIDQAKLPPGSPVGWIGGDFAKPIPLQAGKTYWIAESTGVCSIAASGVAYPYFGGYSLNGPWDGPFKGHQWTSHLIGACEK